MQTQNSSVGFAEEHFVTLKEERAKRKLLLLLLPQSSKKPVVMRVYESHLGTFKPRFYQAAQFGALRLRTENPGSSLRFHRRPYRNW